MRRHEQLTFLTRWTATDLRFNNYPGITYEPYYRIKYLSTLRKGYIFIARTLYPLYVPEHGGYIISPCNCVFATDSRRRDRRLIRELFNLQIIFPKKKEITDGSAIHFQLGATVSRVRAEKAKVLCILTGLFIIRLM